MAASTAESWECAVCTYICNGDPAATKCAMCDTARGEGYSSSQHKLADLSDESSANSLLLDHLIYIGIADSLPALILTKVFKKSSEIYYRTVDRAKLVCKRVAYISDAQNSMRTQFIEQFARWPVDPRINFFKTKKKRDKREREKTARVHAWNNNANIFFTFSLF